MSVPSPADRVRRAFLRIGSLVALVAFLVMASDVLLGQWITGYASGIYIFGTAALIAGFCLGLFAMIVSFGLAIAAAFRGPDAPPMPAEEAGPPSVTPEHVPG